MMILNNLLQFVLFLYTPLILNTNIEQEVRNMVRKYTKEEQKFIEYFRQIDTEAITEILSHYRSTGPEGYSASLILCRILKIKERISSDRELSEKLAKISIYRDAVGINKRDIPAHNTFTILRQRLGPAGFARIHRYFVMKAYKHGLLIPPIEKLPAIVKNKIILIADSTFLLTAASTKGEKDEAGEWLFSDESIAFGRPHHKHKYPVGHRAHTLMSVNGIPLISKLAPANEHDKLHIISGLRTMRDRYPEFPFGSIILDTGYDDEKLHKNIYLNFNLIPVIIRKSNIKYGKGFSDQGTPLCPLVYPTKRKGIEYKNHRTKYACFHVCKKDPHKSIFPCPYEKSNSRFGWMTHTHFKDSYRKFGPAVPTSRVYRKLKPLRTGIERYYGLAKENRYRMEKSNTYTGHDNVLIHVIEHDIVLTLDIIFNHFQNGKWSDVLSV